MFSQIESEITDSAEIARSNHGKINTNTGERLGIRQSRGAVDITIISLAIGP